MDKMIFTSTCHRAVIALAAIIASSLTLLSPQVDATIVTVNVDFAGRVFWTPPPTPVGTYTGSAVAPDNGGTFWNGVDLSGYPTPAGNGTSGALVTSAGIATVNPVTVTMSSIDDAADATFFGTAAIAPDLLNDAETVEDGNVGNFSINGLTIGGSYDLYLYSQNAGTANAHTIFTINASNQTAANPGNVAAFTVNWNYVVYTGLIATGGTISGTFQNDPGATDNNGVLNGFQLVGDLALATPEPSTVTLLVLGSLLCVRARRR